MTPEEERNPVTVELEDFADTAAAVDEHGAATVAAAVEAHAATLAASK